MVRSVLVWFGDSTSPERQSVYRTLPRSPYCAWQQDISIFSSYALMSARPCETKIPAWHRLHVVGTHRHSVDVLYLFLSRIDIDTCGMLMRDARCSNPKLERQCTGCRPSHDSIPIGKCCTTMTRKHQGSSRLTSQQQTGRSSRTGTLWRR